MRAGLFFILMGMVIVSFSQKGMTFEKSIHDFGEIKEEKGPVNFTFTFANTSDDTIKIHSVKASCGCTTPGWTREPVAPGDSGFVTAQYNTFNRPGKFRKSLRINSNLGSTVFLYITGTVLPRPKTIAEKLPTKMGNLRFLYRSLNVGRITTEKAVERTFDVYNDSKDTIEIDLASSTSPSFISLGATKTTLLPKEEGKIVLTYDPLRKDDLGFVTDQVTLMTTDRSMPEKTFAVNTTITEYFPPMEEEEMAKAPRLSIDNPQFDFGRLSSNSEKEGSISLTNNGRSKLNIRKISSNCSCIRIISYDKNIKPGRTGKIKLVFDSKGRRGRQYKTMTVFSNDPVAPTQVISVKADVDK